MTESGNTKRCTRQHQEVHTATPRGAHGNRDALEHVYIGQAAGEEWGRGEE